ncbi:heavy metal translocating P-type ATPase [bacterium]|nr:heavy metal translocating P-type ATPase [bacterium]
MSEKSKDQSVGVSDCFHCHLPLSPGSIKKFKDKRFCCNGCLSVYKILQSSGLGQFYQLAQKEGPGKRLQDYNPSLKFVHFDEDDKLEKTFYLEGVHCLACLWLIESSQERVPGIESVRLNMSTSQVTVKLAPTGRFSEIASYFNQLGYFPHLLESARDGADLFKLENYQMLKRIGVAGFCAGNIMLLAISIYGGADGRFFEIFSWLSAALYIPAVLYSAWPFYQNAYRKFLQRKVALDIPVAILLIVGSFVSYVNVFRASEHFYFDSLSVFIFLLLSARFFLRRVQQTHSSTQGVQSLFDSSECLRLAAGDFIRVSVRDLQVGDTVRLMPGETVPLDLLLDTEKVYANTALITGEHLPRCFRKGDTLFAGFIVLSGNVDGKVIRELKKTQLGAILKSIENSWSKGGEEVQFADKLATYLLLFAFALSAGLVFYFTKQGDWSLGMERAMAVLIVTCPCALGLGTPLAFINGLKNLFKKQIVVKNGDVLGRIAAVKNVYFDKTGTITKGDYSVVKESAQLDASIASKIFAIEKNSIHPVALGLCRYVSENFVLDESLQAQNVTEELGAGIKGDVNGHQWKIIKSQVVDFDVDVFCDEQIVVSFALDDSLKEETLKTIEWFREQNINVFMLTGDHVRNAQKIADMFELRPENVFADQLPASKAEKIKLTQDSMMVGDGYNDVIAFESAAVGVALGKKVDLQLKNADVFVPSGRLEDLVALFKEARATKRRLRRSFAFSAFYNLLGIAGSVLGYISPLGAAILMPISSLTVLISSVWKGKNI